MDLAGGRSDRTCDDVDDGHGLTTVTDLAPRLAHPTSSTTQTQDYLSSNEGAAEFLLIDTANQGDLSKADGNFSRDDVEAAAGGPELRALVRELLSQGDSEVTNQLINMVAANVQASARSLLREENCLGCLRCSNGSP